MTASPAVPPAAAALGAPDVHAFLPPATREALDKIGADLNLNNSRRAKIQLDLLKGLPDKVQSAVRALIEEVAAAPKLADDAMRPDFGARIRAIVSEEEFHSLLMGTDNWEGALSHLIKFFRLLKVSSVVYLPNTKAPNSQTAFLKDFFISVEPFFRTNDTGPMVRVINHYFEAIANQSPEKRTICVKIIKKGGVQTPGIVPRSSVEMVQTRFTGLFNDFRAALQHAESARLRDCWWDRLYSPINSYALSGYGHLSFFNEAFSDIILTLDDFLDRPDEKWARFDDELERIQHMVLHLDHFGTNNSKRLCRKFREYYENARTQFMEFHDDILAAYKRYQDIYAPIFKNAGFSHMLANCECSPATKKYLETHEQWLQEIPQFVIGLQQRINQNCSRVVATLRTLLGLHEWLHSGQLMEWPRENLRFDQLVASLPERLERLNPQDREEITSRYGEEGVAYKQLLEGKIQAYIELQSMFNGMLTLYTHDFGRTQRLRSVKNFPIVKLWRDVEPIFRYKSIKWPTNNVTRLFNEMSRVISVVPAPTRQFSFFSPMTRADIPFLEAIRLNNPQWAYFADSCLTRLKPLKEGESVVIYTKPDMLLPGKCTDPKCPAHLAETACTDHIDEDEVKAAAEAPTGTEMPPVYRIRDFLSSKTAVILSKKTALGVNEAVTQAQTQINNLCTVSYTLEQSLAVGMMTKEELYNDCVSIVEAASLTVEQLLHAINRQANPVKNEEDLERTHHVVELLKKNPDFVKTLTPDEHQNLLDFNQAVFDTRDIPFLVSKGRIHTPSQKLLIKAYKYHRSSAEATFPISDLSSYCITTFRLIRMMVDYLAKAKGTSPSDEFLDLTNRWQLAAPAREIAPKPAHPITALQVEANKHLAEIERFVEGLRGPEVLGAEDCDLNFENLINNHLSRLKTEITSQATLTADQISKHYGNVLNLCHLIAPEILSLNLLAMEKNGSAVEMPKGEKTLRALVTAHNGRELTTELVDFVETPYRNVVRYPEGADSKRAPPKVASAAKKMKRANRRSAAAAGRRPVTPPTAAAAPAPAKAAPAAPAAAAPAAPAGTDEGFTVVDFDIDTKKDAVKAIRLLRDLITVVCVPPRKA